MCWSLSALTVGAIRGEDVVRSILFGHRMTHFSATFAMAGSGDMICFGSLEFPTPPPVGMWVPPVFKPSQAFFGSLDFVADRLGVLHLREEALVPALVRGAPSIGSRTHDDFNDEVPTFHSKQTLCSNPAMSNAHTVIYSLFTISHLLFEGTALSAPQTPYDRFPCGLAPPRTHALRGSKEHWCRPLSHPNSWEWRAMLLPLSMNS